MPTRIKLHNQTIESLQYFITIFSTGKKKSVDRVNGKPINFVLLLVVFWGGYSKIYYFILLIILKFI